jgi:uncharacterized protein involved in outer membrane biogenesis
MKKTAKIAGIFFALILVGMVLVYVFINSIAKGVVENAGTMALGTPVTLEAINIRPFAGHIDFQRLRVANPEGFSEKAAFSLMSFSADVDISTLMSDRVIVKEVLVNGLSATWEGFTGGNHQKLLENLEAFTGSSEAEGDEAPIEDKKVGQKNVVMQHVAITNTTINLIVLGLDKNISLPDKEFTNLGEDGKSLNETLLGAYQGFVGFVNSITSAGGKLIDGAGDAVKGAGEAVKGGLDKVKSIFD